MPPELYETNLIEFNNVSLVSNEGVSLIPAVAILRSDQVFAGGEI